MQASRVVQQRNPDVFVSVDNIVELKKQENFSNLRQGVKTI